MSQNTIFNKDFFTLENDWAIRKLNIFIQIKSRLDSQKRAAQKGDIISKDTTRECRLICDFKDRKKKYACMEQ